MGLLYLAFSSSGSSSSTSISSDSNIRNIALSNWAGSNLRLSLAHVNAV
jgi:hypothetical protein